MKRTALFMLALFAGAIFAKAEIVESPNAVCVSRSSSTCQYSQVTSCFQALGGSDEIAIGDLIPTNELCAWNFDLNEDWDDSMTDMIFVFNGYGYRTYFYCIISETGDPTAQWYDDNFMPGISKTFKRGDTFWYKRGTNSTVKTLTMLGQVPRDASYEHTTVPTGLYFMAGSAYPKPLPFSNLEIAAYANPTVNVNASDRILIGDGGGIRYTTNFFCDFGELGDPQWYDQTLHPSTNVLKIGEGFWFMPSSEDSSVRTWTETRPY